MPKNKRQLERGWFALYFVCVLVERDLLPESMLERYRSKGRMQTDGTDGAYRSEHSDEIWGQWEKWGDRNWVGRVRGEKKEINDESIQNMLNLKKQTATKKTGTGTYLGKRLELRAVYRLWRHLYLDDLNWQGITCQISWKKNGEFLYVVRKMVVILIKLCEYLKK